MIDWQVIIATIGFGLILVSAITGYYWRKAVKARKRAINGLSCQNEKS